MVAYNQPLAEHIWFRVLTNTSILMLQTSLGYPVKAILSGLAERPGGFAASIGSGFRGLGLTVWGLGL